MYGEMGKNQSASGKYLGIHMEVVRKAMKFAGHLLSWLRFDIDSL
jgi:hypothetical protein